MRRRIFSLLLALVMALSLTPVHLYAAERETPPPAAPMSTVASGDCGDSGSNVTWQLDDQGTLTISGTGAMKEYDKAPWYSERTSIKKVLIDSGVTSISKQAFYNCSNLESVSIPDSVTDVGLQAFLGCNALEAVYITDLAAWCHIVFTKGAVAESYGTNPLQLAHNLYLNGSLVTDLCIPLGVTSINFQAFYYCTSIQSVTIPGSVTSISESAFYGCSALTSVTIEEGVTSIGNGAFEGCHALLSVAFPASVTFIDHYAFSLCECLSNIWFLGSAPRFASRCFFNVTATVYYITGDTWTDGVKDNNYLGGTLTWKEWFQNEGTCGDNVTWGLNINGDLIIDGTGEMYDYGTSGNATPWNAYTDQIQRIIIRSGVTSIGASAFTGCSALTSVTIPESVTDIGNAAFKNCVKLTSLIIPESVTSIGSESFFGCTSLVYVSIPDGLTRIGAAAFCGCKAMQSITIPSGVTQIENYTFQNCTYLQNVTIPSDTTDIGAGAFFGCSMLRTLTVPAGVTRIGSDAFSGCTRLTSLMFLGSAPTFCDDCFSGVTATVQYAYDATWTTEVMQNYGGTLTWKGIFTYSGSCGSNVTWGLKDGDLVIDGTGNMYDYNYSSNTPPWKSYGSQIKHVIVRSGVTRIGSYAFYSFASNLETLQIEDADLSIGYEAFYNTPLQSIDFGTGAIIIGSNAFEKCNNLTELVLETNVSFAGGSCKQFYYCESLESVTLRCSELANETFMGCSKLSQVTMDGVNKIGRWVFEYCSELHTVTIPATVTEIARNAFIRSGVNDVYILNADVKLGDVAGDTVFAETNATIHAADCSTAHAYAIQFGHAFVTLEDDTSVHTYSEPIWDWRGNNTIASAVFSCTAHGDDTQTVEAEITSAVTAPTCIEDGYITYTATVTFLGEIYTNQRMVTDEPATGHHFGGEPEWEWNEDLTEAYAIFHCADCDEVDSVLAEQIDYDRQEPTHVRDGYISATVVATYNGQDYYENHEIVLPALGHTYGEPAWTWNEDYTASAAFTCDCGYVLTVPAEITYTDQPATHFEMGLRTYTAAVTLDETTYTDQTTAVLPLTPHEYETVWTWSEDLSAASVHLTCTYGDDERDLEAEVEMERIDATAEEDGAFVYTATAVCDGQTFTDEQRVTIHFYGAPVWTWSEDHSAAAATFTCVNCGDVQTVEATVTVATTEPTHTVDGEAIYTAVADFEGETYTDVQHVVLPALGHNYGEPEWIWAPDGSAAHVVFRCTGGDDEQELEATVTQSRRVEPTCTEPGSIKYVGSVVFEGRRYTDTYTVTLPALGHSYGEPVWTWSEDHSTAAVSLTCAACGDVQTVEATVTVVTTEPTHTVDGEAVYTAVADFEGETYTNVQHVVLPALGHTYGEPEWTWAPDGSAASVVFRCLGGDDEQELEATVTQSHRVEPTCTEPGSVKYIGSVRFEGQRYTDTYTVTLPALGHTYGEPVWTWSEDHSAAAATFTCVNCGDVQTVEATVTVATTEPTHTVDGEAVYTAVADFEGETYTDMQHVVLPALGHSYGAPVWTWSEDHGAASASFTCDCGDTQTVEATVTVATTEPTHAADGVTVYTAVADFEGQTYTDTYTEILPALGHTYGAPVWTWSEDHGAASASFTCDCGDTQTVNAVVTVETTEPTHAADGATVYTAEAVFEGQTYTDTYTEILPALGHTYGAPVWTWSEDHGAASASFTCDCGDTQTVNAAVTVETTEPTHAADGATVYTAEAVFEGQTYTDTYTEILPALGHSYGAPVWTWSEDHGAASASFTCDCGDTQTVEATVTVATTEPTHVADGATVYTATVVFQGRTYTDTYTVILPALGHSYGAPVWTWSEDHGAASASFTCDCGDVQTVNAAVSMETTEPTHTERGEKVYTATVVFQGETYTDTYTEILPIPLEILSQPQNYTGPIGDTASFTVEAAGEGLSYQWQYKSLKDGKWYNTKTDGYNTATMSIGVTKARDGMEFRCKVTDAYGSQEISDAAALHLAGVPAAITDQPEDFAGPIGATASFTVTATGDGLTYQWQYKSAKDGKWYNAKVDGANTATMSIGVTKARDGMEFRCKVTDAYGNQKVSDPAALHVAAAALAITGQPEDYAGAIGETASFTVTAEGTGLTYQWQYKSLKDGKWYNTKTDGYNTPTMSIGVTKARDGMEFRCKVTDAYGSQEISDAAALHLAGVPAAITGQPEDFAGPIGETASFTVTATGTGLAYQWQYKSKKDGKWYNAKAEGADTAAMSIEVTASRDGMEFRCKVTDAYGNQAISDAATLRVG